MCVKLHHRSACAVGTGFYGHNTPFILDICLFSFRDFTWKNCIEVGSVVLCGLRRLIWENTFFTCWKPFFPRVWLICIQVRRLKWFCISHSWNLICCSVPTCLLIVLMWLWRVELIQVIYDIDYEIIVVLSTLRFLRCTVFSQM